MVETTHNTIYSTVGIVETSHYEIYSTGGGGNSGNPITGYFLLHWRNLGYHSGCYLPHWRNHGKHLRWYLLYLIGGTHSEFFSLLRTDAGKSLMHLMFVVSWKSTKFWKRFGSGTVLEEKLSSWTFSGSFPEPTPHADAHYRSRSFSHKINYFYQKFFIYILADVASRTVSKDVHSDRFFREIIETPRNRSVISSNMEINFWLFCLDYKYLCIAYIY